MPYSPGLMMPAGLAGMDVYATESHFKKEYANAAGATRATATITTTLELGAAAGDQLTFTFTPVGMAPFTTTYTLEDPVPAGADLHSAIAAALKADTRIYGLGKLSSDATKVTFESWVSGQQLTISASVDPSVGAIAVVVNNGSPLGERIPAGRVCVTDPSVVYAAGDSFGEGPNKIAFLPTQDLNLGPSTQLWAGISHRTDEENLAVTVGFPGFSSENSSSSIVEPQLCIKERGHSQVELETAFTGDTYPALNYRFAADGDKNQLGILSFDTGTGLAAVPVPYRIDRVVNGGAIAWVDFGLPA